MSIYDYPGVYTVNIDTEYVEILCNDKFKLVETIRDDEVNKIYHKLSSIEPKYLKRIYAPNTDDNFIQIYAVVPSCSPSVFYYERLFFTEYNEADSLKNIELRARVCEVATYKYPQNIPRKILYD